MFQLGIKACSIASITSMGRKKVHLAWMIDCWWKAKLFIALCKLHLEYLIHIGKFGYFKRL